MSARPRIVAIVLLVILAAGGVFLATRKAAQLAGDAHVVHKAAPAFNLRHPESMRELPPTNGELLHLKRAGVDEFIVQPLHLPAYKGDVGGLLPVLASRELDALRKQYPQLEPVEEGKTRINRVAGYTLVFRASRSPRLYGRLVLLPEPTPGAREGVKLLLFATPDGGADKARDVAQRGELKVPYRSFRFGTEGP
jgi:hypothetical protein